MDRRPTFYQTRPDGLKRKVMGRQTRIHIETHEITIIRFGTIRPIDDPVESPATTEVCAHGETDPTSTDGKEKQEKEIQNET